MKKLLLSLLFLFAGLVFYDLVFPETAAKNGLALERWRSGLNAQAIQVGDMQIQYTTGGQGDALVLIHGFGADKDNWTRVAGQLTDKYKVFAIDLPGFGASSRLESAAYDIPSQVARLHAILTALKLERFHMGGSSMGGNITLEYAASYPEQVQSMWLLAPAGVAGGEISELRKLYASTGHNSLIVKSAEDFPSIMNFTMSNPPWLPYSVKHVLGLRAAQDYALHKRIFAELNQSASINERIAGSHIPTLIVWGDQDRALHVSGANILHGLLPNSKLIVRPGVGHLPMIEEPSRSAHDWLAFQQSLH